MTECTAPLDLRLLTKLHKRKINTKEPTRRKRSHSPSNSPDLLPSQSIINSETGTNQHQCKRRIDIFICPICRKHTTCLEGFAEHMALHVTRGSTTTSERSEVLLNSEKGNSIVKFGRNNLSPAVISKTSSQMETKFAGQVTSSHMTNKDQVATTQRRDNLETKKPGVPDEKSVCTICCPVTMLPNHLSLKEHIQSNHIKVCYQCQCCERYFSSKLACENHIFTHHVGQPTAANLTDTFHETVSYLIPILRNITANSHSPIMLVGGQSMEQQREPLNWSAPTILPASHVEKQPRLSTNEVKVSEPSAGLLPEIILKVLQHILPTCRSVVQEQLHDDNKSCAATENDACSQFNSSPTTTKEFTDEMAVLRHQVEAHSLDDITNKQKK
ncbi:zinc finger, C2H2 type [Opisthorchis viverrini]|uniref:Zinc finger, C2H2 type n=1 Tax=Opisthorchis viverrini TaxID=6198 RepID=A0A1S8WIX1_OPIVI|nr:zinc finger, C2H2 type [Opisthorchis viverrini]